MPSTHPTGTFWYHPHKHGSVGYQLASGMAGAIIVEGAPAGANDLESIPAVAAADARGHVFVLQQLSLRVAPGQIGWVYPDDVYNAEDNKRPVTPAGVLKLPGQPPYATTTVNGVVMPTLELRPGEVQRWRFVHAGREDVEQLTWADENGNPAESPLYVIARDGLATGSCERKAQIDLYPGYRCDVLVKAPATPNTTYFLSAVSPTPQTALRKRNVGGPTKYLAKVVVKGDPLDMALPRNDELAACRPPDAPAVTVPPRTVEFNLDDQNKVYTLNGQSFSQQTQPVDLRPKLGDTELWNLSVASGDYCNPDLHPFHIHVNPFQVKSIQARKRDLTWVDVKELSADPLEKPWIDLIGQWKDTLLIDSNHKVTVATTFADWPGRTVLHCHILDHEDQGMMRYVEILNRDGQPVPLAGLRPLDAPAPAVRLPDVDGTPCDLAAPGQATVLVFFRGLGCTHCTRQLRGLVQAADRLPAGTRILAVTDQPISKAEVTRAGLGDGRLRLIPDADRAAFKAFGCLDPEPRHALAVVAPDGRLRYRYVGGAPFDDLDQVVAAAKRVGGAALTGGR